jgi:hypothetical protein
MTEVLRICSLLPSATEIVFALGLGGRVGVTHECGLPVTLMHPGLVARPCP